jgi:alpha-tubulin suppressor-like RCC1 family protein
VTGDGHTCAILANDTVKCWGSNSAGRLGYGDTLNRGDGADEMGSNLPVVDLGSGRTAKAIIAGAAHTCALLDNNTVKCWGLNYAGQLGLGDTENRGDGADEMGSNLPAVDLGSGRTAKAISAGKIHTCAILDDGSVKCWGYNSNGQLGLDDTDSRGDGTGEMGAALPTVYLGSGRTAKAIAAGGFHTCALLDDSSVKCWGANAVGQLGLGDTTNRGDSSGDYGMASLTAVDVGSRTITQLVTGAGTTCVLFDTGAVACWGVNIYGQLGIGTADNRGDGTSEMGTNLQLVDLGSGHTAKSLSAAALHTCAILDDDSVKCWGGNDNGLLG